MNIESLCPKPCHIYEYFGEESLDYKRPKRKDNGTHFIFLYRFNEVKPVTIYDEYFVYDDIGLISSIGGTLGLCIGFSFTNVVTCFINFLQRLEKIKLFS